MDILHFALEYPDESKADIFFQNVLGLQFVREFTLKADFSWQIFRLRRQVKVKVFANEKMTIEVFIRRQKIKKSYKHICLKVKSIKALLEKCSRYGISGIKARKNNKLYLFIQDYAGYLYEIKEIKM